MMFMLFDAQCGVVLGDSEKKRLEKIAPLFDIEFRQLDPTRYRLEVRDGAAVRVAELAARYAHTRLLTEICEKAINWVYFRAAEHCAQTLLSLPDSKIQRIAQLYRLRKAGHQPPDAE